MGYSEIIQGLKIFLEADPEGYPQAEHDIIYGPGAEELSIDLDTINYLKDCGWHVDSVSDCWAHFC